MWLIFCLLFLFQLFECNNSELTQEQLLSLPIPDLAYDPNNQSFASLNLTQKIYLESLFTKSVYFPKCDRPPKPIIQPIYFWPGKRIDLPCRMCRRPSVYNGKMKYWEVLRRGISDEISNIMSKLRIESDKWEIINQKFSDNFVSEESQVKIPRMPQRKNGNESNATPKEAYRPKTQFFQRDGKLIILHPHMDSYGLYRCFDSESSAIVNFIYFLIPITPVLTMFNWKVHLHQCNPKKASFRYLDEFHQFHFLPAILPEQKDICPKFKTASSEEDYCSVDKFNGISQPSLNNIINVSKFDHPGDQEFIAKKTNLKIFISWSKWSSCNAGEAMKTRYGFCHIGKFNPSKKLEEPFQHGETIKRLHKFLDNVEEFKINGIRLFSGVLADVISDGKSSTHCNDYTNLNEIYEKEIEISMIKLIKAVTNDSISDIREKHGYPNNLHFFESVCFRSIDVADDIKIEYGQKIIQNKPC